MNEKNKQKTFLIFSAYNKEFTQYMKDVLIKKGWKESYHLPVDFMFLYFSYRIESPIIDTKRSKLVNLICGKTFDNILDNELFIKKYKNEYFAYPYKFINKDNINNINLLDNNEYSIWPVCKKYMLHKYPKKVISSKKEIIDHINLYPEKINWLIRDELNQPVLKNGYIFSLNYIFIIKLNPFKIYAIKNKKYIKAKEMFNHLKYKNDPKVYKSTREDLYDYDKEISLFFPEDLPDGWDQEETNYINELLENSISILFKDKIDLKPDNNSENGYFIFNAYVKLYEGLPPLIYYILNTFSASLHKHIVPALISIIVDNKDHPDFKLIDYKKTMDIDNDSMNNFKYDRVYSFGRFVSVGNQKVDPNTFYVRMHEEDFELELSDYLMNKGHKFSDEFPVNFILLSGYPSYYKNRFDSRGSNWISLLYGNSKTEITNKILLHKKYKNSDFILPAYYLIGEKEIENIDESTLKILKPLNGFSGDGITIVKTKNEVKEWIRDKENQKYKEWLLEKYLIEPDLKEGYKFHFRVFTLVKVEVGKKVEVYLSNHKF